jgi:suppressor of fused-like protein
MSRRAIDEAMRALYPREPVTFGAGVGVLAEIRAYLHPATTEDPEHWHFVTLGLSELDAKTSTDLERSGWGFELTMRVEAPDGERELPKWPALALAKLAIYVDEFARILDDGHHVSVEDYVDDAPLIKGLALRRDPELGRIDTPHGALEFLQTVGVTADENELLTRWSVKAFLDVLAKQTPLLLTRPERPSLLRDPVIGPLLEQRAASEGSSQTLVLAETLAWQMSRWPRKKIRLSLGPGDMTRKYIRPLLASRTSRGQQFRIVSGGRTLRIHPGENADWEATGDTLLLTMSPALVAELEAFLAADQPSLQSQSVPGLVVALVE